MLNELQYNIISHIPVRTHLYALHIKATVLQHQQQCSPFLYYSLWPTVTWVSTIQLSVCTYKALHGVIWHPVWHPTLGGGHTGGLTWNEALQEDIHRWGYRLHISHYGGDPAPLTLLKTQCRLPCVASSPARHQASGVRRKCGGLVSF